MKALALCQIVRDHRVLDRIVRPAPAHAAAAHATCVGRGTSRDAGCDDLRRWFAGDLHMHVAPLDGDAKLTVAEIAQAARDAGLDFVAQASPVGAGAARVSMRNGARWSPRRARTLHPC